MATDTQKSATQPHEVEKPPTKTLTLNPTNLPDATKNPSSDAKEEQAELESQSATLSTGKEELQDSMKGTAQAETTVVLPTGDIGPVNVIQKKLRRAERFGVPVQLSEEEKRNSRAERFGTGNNTGSEASRASEEQKRKARAERFGLSVPADDEAKKKARLTRFGADIKIDALEEEKRKARALRFSQPSSDIISHINCEGDVGQKTAVAGNASGGA